MNSMNILLSLNYKDMKNIKTLDVYLFDVYYLNSNMRQIKVKSISRHKAYAIARIKAIKINNNLDFVELNNVL
jgi:hypothetical protein